LVQLCEHLALYRKGAKGVVHRDLNPNRGKKGVDSVLKTELNYKRGGEKTVQLGRKMGLCVTETKRGNFQVELEFKKGLYRGGGKMKRFGTSGIGGQSKSKKGVQWFHNAGSRNEAGS